MASTSRWGGRGRGLFEAVEWLLRQGGWGQQGVLTMPLPLQNLPKLNMAAANCVAALAVDEWLQTNLLEVG